jgi:hypothetical protein
VEMASSESRNRRKDKIAAMSQWMLAWTDSLGTWWPREENRTAMSSNKWLDTNDAVARQAVKCGETQSSATAQILGRPQSTCPAAFMQVRCVRDDCSHPLLSRVSMSRRSPPGMRAVPPVSETCSQPRTCVSGDAQDMVGRGVASSPKQPQCSAYLCFPSRQLSQCVVAPRLRGRRDCAAVRDARVGGGRDRVETRHTGRSRSRRVRATAVVVVVVVVVGVAAWWAGRRRGRVRAAAGGLDYGSDGDLAGA